MAELTVFSFINFIEFYNITLKEIYKTKSSFYRLCVNAKVKEDFNNIDEQSLAGGMLRLINTDSVRLLKFWIDTLENSLSDNPSLLNHLKDYIKEEIDSNNAEILKCTGCNN